MDSTLITPATWEGVTVWGLAALVPLLVFLPCVLQPDVDLQNKSRKQWFYSTEMGAHRILAEWHTFWIMIVCILSGVAQFLAWREKSDSWYYPTAMIVFYIAVGVQCAWVAAYFRLVKRFTTARNFLFGALITNIALAGLYAPLHKLSTALIVVRIFIHDLPMLVIAIAAVRIHRITDDWGRRGDLWRNESDEDVIIDRADHASSGYESPSPNVPPPPKSEPPRRMSASSVTELLGFTSDHTVKKN